MAEDPLDSRSLPGRFSLAGLQLDRASELGLDEADDPGPLLGVVGDEIGRLLGRVALASNASAFWSSWDSWLIA